MVLQIADITKDTPALWSMLEEAYHDIYVPAFPDPDSREGLDKFMQAMRGEIPGIGIAINILGENLKDPKTRVIKGISIAYYYERHNVGLLAYNAIAPECREKGLGKILVQSRIRTLKCLAEAQGKKLGGVFIEVNDPQKISAENDSMDPSKRVQIFKNWGAVEIPIDYVQPPLTADGYYCDYMRLMNYPVDGHYAKREAVDKYLRGLYREFRVEGMPEEDFHYRQMKAQLKALPASSLPCPATKVEAGYLQGVPAFEYMRKPAGARNQAKQAGY